jgi:hypothetical protein
MIGCSKMNQRLHNLTPNRKLLDVSVWHKSKKEEKDTKSF